MKSSIRFILLSLLLSACASPPAEPTTTNTPTPTATLTPMLTPIYLLNGQEEFELPDEIEIIAVLDDMQGIEDKLVEEKSLKLESTIISIWADKNQTNVLGFLEITDEHSEYGMGTWIGYPLDEEGKPTFYKMPEGAAGLRYDPGMKRIEAFDEDYQTDSSFIFIKDEQGYHLGAEWLTEGKYPENVTPWKIKEYKQEILAWGEKDKRLWLDAYFPKGMNNEAKLNGLVVRDFAWLVDYYELDSEQGVMVMGRFVNPYRENDTTDNGHFDRIIAYRDGKGEMKPIGWYNDPRGRYQEDLGGPLNTEELFDLLIKQKIHLVIESWVTVKSEKTFTSCRDFTNSPCCVSMFKSTKKMEEIVSSDSFPFQFFFQKEIQDKFLGLIRAGKAQDLVELMDSLAKENGLMPVPLAYLLTLN